MSDQKEDSPFVGAMKDIISGTMGGFAQVIAGHPLDTVKVRLQNQVEGVGQTKQFNGTLDTFRKTVQLEGVRGLYKGASSPLAGAMAHNAGVFFSYGQAKKWLASRSKTTEDKLSLSNYFWAGAITGAFVSHIEGPIDLLKVKLQAQVGAGQYKSVWDCVTQLWKQRGPRALYQGYAAVQLRNIPAFATYFEFFEQMKGIITPAGYPPSLFGTFVAGGWAGFGFWGIFYPLDVIKTRMQTDATFPQDRRYKNTLDCINQIFNKEGVPGFYKGYVPAVLRAVIVNACIFYAVSAAKIALSTPRK
jgi:solute carrier family 25 carnitine/acylcarnitine transporter 20/29